MTKREIDFEYRTMWIALFWMIIFDSGVSYENSSIIRLWLIELLHWMSYAPGSFTRAYNYERARTVIAVLQLIIFGPARLIAMGIVICYMVKMVDFVQNLGLYRYLITHFIVPLTVIIMDSAGYTTLIWSKIVVIPLATLTGVGGF